MKKLFKSVLFAAVLGSGATSLGLPVGNPGEPSLLIDGVLWEGASGDPCDPCSTWCDALSLRAGFFGDYVFNRLLKTDVPSTFRMAAQPTGDAAATGTTGKELTNVALHKNMTQSELYTNAGYLALNIWDRFDVFCTLGTTNAYIKGSSNAFNLIGLIGNGNQ